MLIRRSKFRRMIAVYVDITAPLYWWKEFDTYKVGTVANSCSLCFSFRRWPLDDPFPYFLILINLVENIGSLIPEDGRGAV